MSSFASTLAVAKGALLGLGAGLGISKAVEGFRSMIAAASDLNENVNKVQAIFGEGAASVIADSNKMAKAFGTSKNEYLDAAGKFGGLFKGAGFSGKATADLSQQFVRLAGDAASFFNTDFETAFMKLRAGLSGEAEPLRDFGIFLDEDTTKAYAYAHGIARAGQELTNQQKIQARSAQIVAALGDANGDLARTSGGVANLTRNAWGQLENLGATLGQAFLPLVQKGLAAASSFLGAIGEWAQSSGVLQTIGSLIDSVIITPIEFVVGLVRMANDVLSAFGINLVAIFTGALKVIAGVAKAIASVVKALTYGHKETEAVVQQTAAAPKFVQQAQQAKLPAKPRAEIGFAGAARFGSQEAYSGILRSRAQFGNNTQRDLAQHAKVSADNSGKQVAILQAIQKALIGQGGDLTPGMAHV